MLFNRTVRENIALADPGMGMDRLRAELVLYASRLANFDGEREAAMRTLEKQGHAPRAAWLEANATTLVGWRSTEKACYYGAQRYRSYAPQVAFRRRMHHGHGYGMHVREMVGSAIVRRLAVLDFIVL